MIIYVGAKRVALLYEKRRRVGLLGAVKATCSRWSEGRILRGEERLKAGMSWKKQMRKVWRGEGRRGERVCSWAG